MYHNLRIGACKMSHIEYKKRLIETKIKRKLLYSGAVLIDGAKWSRNQLLQYSTQRQ